LRQIKQMVARKAGYGFAVEKICSADFQSETNVCSSNSLAGPGASRMDDGPHATSKPNGGGGTELRTIIRT